MVYAELAANGLEAGPEMDLEAALGRRERIMTKVTEQVKNWDI